jgi:two-component system LytT family sensor kinase
MNDAAIGRIVRWTAILIGIWTVPVIIGTASHFFGMMVEGGGMPASHVFGHSFAIWYVWIPFTPLIFAAYRRRPVSATAWPGAVLLHLAVIVPLFLSQTFAALVVGHYTGHVMPDVTYGRELTNGVVNLFPYDLLIYVGVLAVAFGLDYARRYRDRDLRASQLETQLERARLTALQSQLQPHFLFNALNSVAMLVRRDRKEEALDTLIGFGELLRYLLDEAGTVDVPLDEELRFVRRYLEIEQVRYRDRLHVDWNVSAAARSALVPNLILQPLVENAVKHGIAHLPNGGRLRVAAQRETNGPTLRIEVENDGPPVDGMIQIAETQGTGLRNLRDRLVAIVGPSTRLEVRSAPAFTGALAVVEIAFRETAAQAPAVAKTM